MKIFLKILNYFFTILGVIFFIILILGVYLFVADPFDLKPLIYSFGGSDSGVSTDKSTTDTDKNSLLSPKQEKILESIGINSETLPTEISPELEDCLVEKVGAQRAEEIAKGSEPTVSDFLKASTCLK